MITVTHRRYVPYSHAHYAGNLVDGAYALGLFGDAATEVCIRTDGDEGLFASYSDVQFRSPIRAGDVVEVTATVTRVGGRSRTIDFTCRVVCRGRFAPAVASGQPPAGFIEPAGYIEPSAGSARPSADGGSAAEVLDPPIVAVTATGTVVVPPRR